MKSHQSILLTLFLLLTIKLSAQEKIDNYITITFPQKPVKQELIENFSTLKFKTTVIYLNTDQESLVAIKTILLENGKEKIDDITPTKEELDKIYNTYIQSQIRIMKKKGFIFSDSTKFKIQNQNAYRLKYNLFDKKNQGAETVLLYKNGASYIFTYSQVDQFNKNNKNKFLNSISLNNLEKIEQANTEWFKYGLYLVSIICFTLYFRKASKNKSKIGINLKTIYCPKCNAKQAFFRIPKSISEILYGGTTCPRCSTKLDKYGNIIH